jgi:hypothetical protein
MSSNISSPQARLTGNDIPVVVGMEKRQPLRRGDAVRLVGGLFQRLSHQTDVGTQSPARLDLGQRRAARHHHDRAEAGLARRTCDALRMVSGGGRDHARRSLALLQKAGDLVGGATQLERPGTLQIFQLQMQRQTKHVRQGLAVRLCSVNRCVANALACGFKPSKIEWNGFGCHGQLRSGGTGRWRYRDERIGHRAPQRKHRLQHRAGAPVHSRLFRRHRLEHLFEFDPAQLRLVDP